MLGIIVAAVVIFVIFAVCFDCNPRLWYSEKFGAKPEDKLRGKVVWITGASSGIGEHLAYELAKCGCKLVLSARRKEELDRVKEGCIAHSKESSSNTATDAWFLVLPLDLMNFESHPALTRKVLQHFQKIDILVHCAGLLQVGLVESTEFSVDKRMVDLNVLGVLSLTKAVLPHFLEKEEGHFTVFSSPGGKLAYPTMTLAGATKAIVQRYFEGLREELLSKNIKVTLVIPAAVKSQVMQNALGGDVSKLHIDKDKPPEKAAMKEMSAERCARLVAVAIANELHEIVTATKEFQIFFFLALNCSWLMSGLVRKMQQSQIKELRDKIKKE